MSQIFRFCCKCVRMSLIQNGECFFCKKKFYLKGLKDDMQIRNKRNAESY